MAHNLLWTTKTFDTLTAYQLYNILRLRIDVFMIEQNCLYSECDGKDFKAKHLLGFSGDELVAYARLLPPGITSNNSSIGRIVVALAHRNTGIGNLLVKKSIEELSSDYPSSTIEISAQSHLQTFYEDFDFIKGNQEEYLEDGIPHLKMYLKK